MTKQLLSAYGLVSLVVGHHQACKFKEVKVHTGGEKPEYRYEAKGFTADDMLVLSEGEDLSHYETEQLLESGGWVLMDAFSANAIKQCIEALKPENKATVDRVPILKLQTWAFKCVA